MLIALFMSATLAAAQTQGDPSAEPARGARLFDLDGDGALDLLRRGAQGRLEVWLHAGGRRFEPTGQLLPALDPVCVLLRDLDADGIPDLYLVAHGPNVALLGEGAGRFRQATAQLGLEDGGAGLGAEWIDLDGDGLADLLLDNEDGQVLFWAEPGGGFTRALETPAGELASAEPQRGTERVAGLHGEASDAPAGPERALARPARGGSPGGGLLTSSGTGPILGSNGLGGSMIASSSWPATIEELLALLDARYVNDDALQVDGEDVLPGSLAGAQVSTGTGDVTHAGGSLGLGTTSPLRRLHVATESLGADRLLARFENTADPASNLNRGGIELISGGTLTELHSLGQAYDLISGWTGFSSLTGHGSGVQLAAAAAGGVVRFVTGSLQSERMRITSAGRVGIGTPNPLATTHIVGAPQWSSWNYGANLLLSGPRQNSLGILDSTGANPWAIANTGNGTLTFSAMPPLGNTTSPANRRMLLGSNGMTVWGEVSSDVGFRLPDGTLLSQATGQPGEQGEQGEPGPPGMLLQYKGVAEPNAVPIAVGALWIETGGSPDRYDWFVYLAVGTQSLDDWVIIF